MFPFDDVIMNGDEQVNAIPYIYGPVLEGG